MANKSFRNLFLKALSGQGKMTEKQKDELKDAIKKQAEKAGWTQDKLCK
jgi:hypothetical protein